MNDANYPYIGVWIYEPTGMFFSRQLVLNSQQTPSMYSLYLAMYINFLLLASIYLNTEPFFFSLFPNIILALESPVNSPQQMLKWSKRPAEHLVLKMFQKPVWYLTKKKNSEYLKMIQRKSQLDQGLCEHSTTCLVSF